MPSLLKCTSAMLALAAAPAMSVPLGNRNTEAVASAIEVLEKRQLLGDLESGLFPDPNDPDGLLSGLNEIPRKRQTLDDLLTDGLDGVFQIVGRREPVV
ncbi:hypothetical protein F4808DRAFT_463274 [Astrocystis sublimbata]|nr:hypothetical protein F4808DRAFT_463274 [Astrocystis sublimbata]